MVRNASRVAFLALLAIFFRSVAHAESEEELGMKLVAACYHGNAPEAVRLLREGADANFTAAAADKSIRFTSKTGAIVFASDWTPIIALSDSPNIHLPAAIAGDAEGESTGREEADELVPDSCLCHSRLVILYALYSNGANLDYRTHLGNTALHHAANSRSLCLAAHLVKLGAAVDITNKLSFEGPANRLALHNAAWSQELREILIEAGAPDDLPDSSGMTPRQLHEEFIRYREIFEPKPGDEPFPDRFNPFIVPGAERETEPEGGQAKRSSGKSEEGTLKQQRLSGTDAS